MRSATSTREDVDGGPDADSGMSGSGVRVTGPGAGILSRPRLAVPVACALPGGVVSVTGLPGSGRSTVVAQAAGMMSVPVVTMSATLLHNDAAEFGRGMARTVGADLSVPGRRLASLRRAWAVRDPSSIVAAWGSLPHHLFLLDDADEITSPSMWRLLARVVARLPVTTTLVVLSAVDPPIGLPGLRAAGHLVEIRDRDLRFEPSEVTELAESLGLVADDDEIAALMRTTEGWAVAVALGLRGWDERALDTPDSRFAPVVAELVVDTVLTRLSAEELSFVTAIAVADRVCPDLCDAITGRPGSVAVLRSLSQRTGLITARSAEPGWYDLSHLLTAYLRSEASAVGVAAHAEHALRAARWFDAAGQLGPAIDLAVRGGDTALAADLLERHEQEFFDAGNFDSLARWYGALPVEDDLPADQSLRLGWAELLSGGSRLRVQRILHDVENRVAERPGDLGLRAERDLLEAALAWDRGEVAHTEAAAGRAVAGFGAGGEPSMPSHLLAVLLVVWAAMMSDRPEAAAAGAAGLLARSAAWDDLRWRQVHGTRAWLLSRVGECASAQRMAAEVLDVVGHPDADRWVPFMPWLALGRCHAESGDSVAAQADFDAAAETGSDMGVWGAAMIGLLVERERARALALGGRAELASVVLRAAAESAADAGLDPTVVRDVRAEAARADATAARAARRPYGITEREQEVLAFLPSRMTSAGMAEVLFVSPHTVKSHLKSIYRKLDVADRDGAVDVARALGLLPPASPVGA